MPHHKSPLERIFDRVTVAANGCWICDLGVGPTSYAYVSMGRARLVRAHRYVYEQLVGPIPAGLVLDHVDKWGCVSRACVNPDHLEPVSRGENVRRGRHPCQVAARTNICARGHDNWRSNGRGHRTCATCADQREKERRGSPE